MEHHQPATARGGAANALTLLPLSGHNGRGHTCCWLAPVAFDPSRTSGVASSAAKVSGAPISGEPVRAILLTGLYFAATLKRMGEVSLSAILPFIRKAGIVFDDRVTQIIGEAFDTACKELHDKGQPAIVYEIIAKRIIDSAKNGERDLVRLRNAGLAGLGLDDDKEAS